MKMTQIQVNQTENNDPVYKRKYKGFTIEVYPDEFAESPRELDNLGEMICFHRRYDLGDKHNCTLEDARDLAAPVYSVSFPLYLYDHSGITIATKPFSCPWDSGQVGWIIARHKKIKEEYSSDKATILAWEMTGQIPGQLKEKVERILESEVKTYDDYLRGNVFGYKIKNGEKEEVDSCWGFFGDYDDQKYSALVAAKEAIDSMVKSRRKAK